MPCLLCTLDPLCTAPYALPTLHPASILPTLHPAPWPPIPHPTLNIFQPYLHPSTPLITPDNPKFLEDPMEQEEVSELVTFWNRNVFPADSSAKRPITKDSALSRLKERRAANMARRTSNGTGAPAVA
ncbi:hypothetical protein Hypma_004537 [Hypsizygus marmoreus]|uniref:Uncharacterized protein n=1 Tax=Hypsizygus marmoreus TaxID=39966 RepID=A0A369K8L1_HYPMA|nr:hypothetical protein Hypma_004537 [Hypsizygus marmoreus]